MSPADTLPRKLAAFGTLIPVAILIGYAVSQPLDYLSLTVLIGMAVLLTVPILIGAHHLFLVATWNASLTVFFLPGKPRLWMLATVISLGLALLGQLLDRKRQPIRVPSVTWTLIALAVVVAITMQLRGGIGMHSLGGSTYGGRRYVEVILAIAGYFALTSQRVPLEKVPLYITLFFLSSLTAAMSNLVYMAGPGLWWLFLLFPTDLALSQAASDLSLDPSLQAGPKRVAGIAFATMGPYMFMLARYGVKGVLDLRRPWRLVLFLVIMAVGASGGFRSVLILFGLIFLIQFYLEGLHRSPLLPALILAGILGFIGLFLFATRLPLPIQRTVSVLGVPVNPVAKYDADYSKEWRIKIWEILLPDLPSYLLIGKGYTLDPTDLYLTQQAVKRGLAQDYESALRAGDYHSGPLTLYIPLGGLGFLAFGAFLVAGLRLLLANYRYGHPSLRGINTFLLAFFLARIVFFFLAFGAFSSDVMLFTGTVGFSAALNGGVARKPNETPTNRAALTST